MYALKRMREAIPLQHRLKLELYEVLNWNTTGVVTCSTRQDINIATARTGRKA